MSDVGPLTVLVAVRRLVWGDLWSPFVAIMGNTNIPLRDQQLQNLLQTTLAFDADMASVFLELDNHVNLHQQASQRLTAPNETFSRMVAAGTSPCRPPYSTTQQASIAPGIPVIAPDGSLSWNRVNGAVKNLFHELVYHSYEPGADITGIQQLMRPLANAESNAQRRTSMHWVIDNLRA